MKNKMKVPKNTNEKILSNDVEATLIGVMLLLVSLIGLLGKGPVGQFLQYCFVFVFGNFYFLVYGYLIFLSMYLIISKKLFVMKVNMYLFGAILILFSFLIGASSTNVELSISNFSNSYINMLNSTPGISLFNISSFDSISYTGGGYLGYMLRGFLNTCFTSVGTSITVGVFAFVGLSIYLKDFVIYFIKFYKSLRKRQIEKKQKKIEDEKNNRTVSMIEDNEKETTSDSLSENNKDTSTSKVNVDSTSTKLNENNSLKLNESQTSTNNNVEVKKEPEPIIFEEIKKEPEMELFVNDLEDKTNNSSFSSETIKVEDKIEPEVVVTNTSKFDPFEPIETVVSKPAEVYKEKEETDIDFFKDVKDEKPEIKKQEAIVGAQQFEHEEKKPLYSTYQYPPISILRNPQNDDVSLENRIIAETRLNKINELFQQFKIGANAISYTIGPSCTRFNIKMNPGVKVNVLSSIQNEIAINLGGNKTVRLELVVEGRDTSSIEIGNAKIASVSYKECLQAISNKTSAKDKLLIPLGKGIEGNVVTVSIDELPHLLVAGTTGSGKSVFINTVITTLLMRNRPDELKLMLIDPKKVEFSKYNELPHLLCPVITEAVEGKNALKKLVEEMENRYSLFLTNGKGCSKISEYNELADSLGYDKLPNIVMICDEFSDFMSEYGKEIEPLIKRLAQKARACGIYLIICTQRPSVNVITGDIKAVVPSRIALLVPQVVDSRIIVDEGGAESLLGNGDMLARIPHHNSLVRVQGAYINNLEIISVCDFIKKQCPVDYNPNFENLMMQDDLGMVPQMDGFNRKQKDVLHEKAKYHVIESRIASTSNLQSYFGIGYARADHILNCLEDEQVIKRSGNGNRRVVVMTMDEYMKQQEEKKQNE